MTDFWRDSGYHLLAPLENGRLGVTDDFLRAYFMRPEVHPVEESCAAERALHEALMKNPREAVSEARLAALADPDARENYQVVLGFRDRLLKAGTLENCYLDVFLGEAGVGVPPLFLDQLAHAIARSLLEGCTDGLRARAAELLFREQRILLQEGAILAADAETVDMAAATGGFGSLGRLVAEAQTPLRSVELDVLREENAETYWQRAERYDTALQLNFATPGLDALCRVLESWVARFLEIAVSIQPVQQITDERWVWHVGLDAEGSRLLNDLYEGREVDDARMRRLLSLFRLDFAEPSVMAAGLEGRPVYLALAMTEEGRLRLKPQNLLVNLPLAERA
jgi:hypothetical protein